MGTPSTEQREGDGVPKRSELEPSLRMAARYGRVEGIGNCGGLIEGLKIAVGAPDERF